jgi:His/Glu/Gln/Arg/opine family amino acid ABC transporter permease subunit
MSSKRAGRPRGCSASTSTSLRGRNSSKELCVETPQSRAALVCRGGYSCLLLGGLFWAIQRGLEQNGYVWRWQPHSGISHPSQRRDGRASGGVAADGPLDDVAAFACGDCTSLAAGIVVGLCRITTEPVLRGATRVYIEVVRGTPLLVQIYAIYYLLGSALQMDRFVAGVAALTVFTSAYVGEIVRGGIESIERGQSEAARALGLSKTQTMAHVIMPQAMRRMVAPLTGTFISLIKDSSLVSVVAVTELTLAGKTIQGTYFLTMEVWLTVAALYFAMTFPLSMISRWLEKRFAYK